MIVVFIIIPKRVDKSDCFSFSEIIEEARAAHEDCENPNATIKEVMIKEGRFNKRLDIVMYCERCKCQGIINPDWPARLKIVKTAIDGKERTIEEATFIVRGEA